MASNPDNTTMSNNPSGSGGPQFYYDQSAKFNPTTAVVIISLIGGCFVLAFVSVLLRKCIRGESGRTTTQSSTTQSESYQSKSKGLAKKDVDALPLVHREDLGEKDERECPVCLTEFEQEDTLRLLPSCKHVFHQECIDAWFDAHSTCPLCRASLLGQPIGEVKNSEQHVAPGHGEPVETITEVSGSGDLETRHPTSDVHAVDGKLSNRHGEFFLPFSFFAEIWTGRVILAMASTNAEFMCSVFYTTDSRTAAAAPPLGALISRDDERSSARGTLFRNSESFKRAAAVTTSEQQPGTKDSSFRKPSSSIRRSSSLGADLISLRNLLMRQNDQNGNANSTDAPSGSSRWFTRARSLEVARSRDRAEYSRETYSRDEWVTIDLETGKAATNADAEVPSSSSSKVPAAPERAWSERWSLASLKGAMIFPLSRSTSDVSSRSAHLPV